MSFVNSITSLDEEPGLFDPLRENSYHSPTGFGVHLNPLRQTGFHDDISRLDNLSSLRELQIARQRTISFSSSDKAPEIDDDHSVHSLSSRSEKNSIHSEDNRSHLSEGEVCEIAQDDPSKDDRSSFFYYSEYNSSSSKESDWQSDADQVEDKVENDQDWEHSRRKWDLVSHITISQDHTAASNFVKERLLVLKSSPNEQDFESEFPDPTPSHTLPPEWEPSDGVILGREPRVKPFRKDRRRILTAGQEFDASKAEILSPTTDWTFLPTLPVATHVKMESQDQDLANKNIRRQHSPDDMLGQLRARIGVLEQENVGLRGLVKNPPIDLKLALPQSPRWQVLHRLGADRLFLGEPSWILGEAKTLLLSGAMPLLDPLQYFQRHSEIAFVIYKSYSATSISGPQAQAILEEEVLQPPTPETESLRLISDDMIQAFVNFSAKQTSFQQRFPNFDPKAEIKAPYLFWYYYRSLCSQSLQALSPSHNTLMKLLGLWIDTQYGQKYTDADARFSQGFINREVMAYLVRPGDVLISRGKRGHTLAYMATSWATNENPRGPVTEEQVKGKNAAAVISLKSVKDPWVWRVQSWSYGFDGTFFKKATQLDIKLRIENVDDEVNMKDLDILPLRFASKELKRELEKRGEIFWSCRRKRFVSYRVEGTEELNNDGERFMIDFPTYQKLHPDPPGLSNRTQLKREEIPAETMALETPPSGPELLLLPPNITGYNLRRKKWIDLEVDHITDVAWNKRAFDSLVVDEETKELIQALVNNKLAGEKSTDLISGKGNGLIILLHGGPGTGKTFTAESVAEMAEKPLYRVTCGDIGTQPEAVEKYLESVLHLGKIWDCVVLLDEADVFLEERGLADLQRNALVSVFLRVLEYYDGILILTSNRVGTFDEAFKSRIQLALHYENLTMSQRKKIWRNFINRLKSLDDQEIDFDDIDCYIDELANHEMNGRQIRNAITTARQLAKYKEKHLSYTHLKHVIAVAGKFDKYLKGVKEGFTDDQIARDGGLR